MTAGGGFRPAEPYPAIVPTVGTALTVIGGFVAVLGVLFPWVVTGSAEASDAGALAVRSGLDFWRGLLAFALAFGVTLTGLQLWQRPLTVEVVEDRTVVLVGLGLVLTLLAVLTWFWGDLAAGFGNDAAGVFGGGPFGGSSAGVIAVIARTFDPRAGVGLLMNAGGAGLALVGLLLALRKRNAQVHNSP